MKKTEEKIKTTADVDELFSQFDKNEILEVFKQKNLKRISNRLIKNYFIVRFNNFENKMRDETNKNKKIFTTSSKKIENSIKEKKN